MDHRILWENMHQGFHNSLIKELCKSKNKRTNTVSLDCKKRITLPFYSSEISWI